MRVLAVFKVFFCSLCLLLLNSFFKNLYSFSNTDYNFRWQLFGYRTSLPVTQIHTCTRVLRCKESFYWLKTETWNSIMCQTRGIDSSTKRRHKWRPLGMSNTAERNVYSEDQSGLYSSTEALHYINLKNTNSKIKNPNSKHKMFYLKHFSLLSNSVMTLKK